MDEETRKIDQTEVEQELESFDLDDYLLSEFDRLQEKLNRFDITFQVFLHKIQELTNGTN